MFASERSSIAFSQNFLHDPRLAAMLVRRSSLAPDDLVYEIGPGRGIITEQLARQAGRVVAVEKDVRLARLLQRRYLDCATVTIVAGNFLDTLLPRRPYKVFANIPFNCTTAIVSRLTEAEMPPNDAYLVVQRAAAERFLGIPRESLYAALLKPWFEPTIQYRFRRKDFAPPPGVDVVLLRLRKRGPPLIPAADAALYCDFVVSCFTAAHPLLRGPLIRLLGHRRFRRVAAQLGLDPGATPTQVHFEQWLALFSLFQELPEAPAVTAVSGAAQRLLGQQRRLRKSHRTRSVRCVRS